MPKTMMMGAIPASPSVPEAHAPPSAYAIHDLLANGWPELPRVVGLTAVRAVFVAPGLYIAGVRGWRLVGASVAASTTITLGMLALYWWRKRQEPSAAGAPA